MGIRINFYTVVGLFNLKPGDKRFKPRLDIHPDEDYLEEVFGPMRNGPEDWLDQWLMMGAEYIHDDDFSRFYTLSDVLYNWNGKKEYWHESVVGYIVSKGQNGSNIFYALASIEKKYQDSGFKRIPVLDPETNQMRIKYYGFTSEDIACGRFIQYESSPGVLRSYWAIAELCLKRVGWQINQKYLRMGLVWDWS